MLFIILGPSTASGQSLPGKLLKFDCIYLFQLGKLMFQFKNGLLPRTFDSKLELNSQIHNYDTRSSKLFHIPKI